MLTTSSKLLTSLTKPLETEEKISNLKQKLFSMNLDLSSVTVETIQTMLSQIKTLYRATYNNVAALRMLPEKMTFSTIVQPLIDLDIIANKAISICTFPKHIHIDKIVRDASSDAAIEIENLNIECHQRSDVFKVIQKYEAEIYPKEIAHLHPEEMRFFTNMTRDYKRNGLFIKDEKVQERVTQIKKEIAELSIKFEKNVAEDNTSFIMTKEELAGLPSSWFTKERQIAENQYNVTLQYPDVFPIMDYAVNRKTRETIYTAFESRCEKENIPILKKILQLRQEAAHLLGYKCHADYVAETRLVKNAKKVKDFLEEMNERFNPLLIKNLQDITDFAKKFESNSSFELQYYDMRYYLRLREEALFNINMEKVREYFPLNTVIQGTLKIYEDIFEFKFVQDKSQKTWHEDVSFFKVYNFNSSTKTMSEKPVGGFYLDLHPRAGKYSHAAAFTLINSCDTSHLSRSQEREPNIAAMLCNFPKNENVPFDDVVTFFHEFGHIMHFMCSSTKLPQFHSDKTETDFVEAPSQTLEKFPCEPSVLKILSCHSETHEPLPEEVALKMKEKDKLHAGYLKKRQLVFSTFDFYIHNLSMQQLENLDLKSCFLQIQHDILKLPSVIKDSFPASFTHLVGGYEAGYYSYMLSDTYAADMFETIFSRDPLSAERGMHYRKTLLSPGASKDGAQLVRDCLDREPKLDAFLKKCGLESKTVSSDKRKERGELAEETKEHKIRKLCA